MRRQPRPRRVAAFSARHGASAQADWPDHPVKFIVPLAPGGAIDFIARTVGEVLSRTLGQQVVVENRTGAGGTIGMDLAMKSPPDGYTVLITNDNAASAPHIMGLSYDYTKELTPVCYLGRQSQIMAVHKDLGVSSVKELVDYVKKNPGLGYATSGVGSNQHVVGAWFAKEAGIKLEHVPYRGAGQAINDLIAAHVKLAFLGPTALMPHYKAGTHQAPVAVGVEARADPAGGADPGGRRLQGPRARRLVRGVRPEGHAACDRRPSQQGDERRAEGRKAPGHLHHRRGRADRRHAGGDRQARPGRFGEIRAAGERAQHQDELAGQFGRFAAALFRDRADCG